jgi:hypothetical protein
MGRLDQNANANANAGLHVAGLATNVRYNSQELAKLLKREAFPSEPPARNQDEFDAAQRRVNRIKFRRYWNAELRASSS